jgi:short-subunit dehydrogenase
MKLIRGKRALVSGVASGIGRAIALRLAGEGVNLFLVDIDETGMAATAAEARAIGAQVDTRRCNLADPADISAAATEVLSRYNGVDILVNNAGITYYGKLDRMSAEHCNRILQINLLAHVQLTHELIPSLLERPEAHILNVCSILGIVGMPKVVAYCTAKFGLVGFSEALRREYGREGLGVTALCPGFVQTNLFTSAPLEQDVEVHKTPPKSITITPERVATAAVKAIYRNRGTVVIEPFARFLYLTKRLAPSLLDFMFHIGRRKRIAKKIAALKEAA